MKKRIVTLLCTAILTLGLTVAPVMASSGPYSPVEVETYTCGPFDEPRVNKVYRLLTTDDPSGIPTEDFERGGRHYYLLDMTIANTDHETVTYTAIFGSVELASAADPQTLGTDDSLGLLLVLSCVAGVIIVAANIKYRPSPIRWRVPTAPSAALTTAWCTRRSAASRCWIGRDCPSASRTGRSWNKRSSTEGGSAHEYLDHGRLSRRF